MRHLIAGNRVGQGLAARPALAGCFGPNGRLGRLQMSPKRSDIQVFSLTAEIWEPNLLQTHLNTEKTWTEQECFVRSK